jgi:hypothetical protein
MGGTDAAENLVEITVTQHAMYHFCNYQIWGNEEDKIAWRMLGKQITVDEAKIEAIKLGSKKGREVQKELYNNQEYMKKYIQKCKESFHNSPHKDKIINMLHENQSKAVEASRTPEAIEKKKRKLKEIKHQQGEKNTQYGKMWITNGTKEGTYRINKGETIPEGYWKGRICFDIKPKGKTASAYGRMWINNGSKNKMIPKELPIPKGYKKGRINTHKIS